MKLKKIFLVGVLCLSFASSAFSDDGDTPIGNRDGDTPIGNFTDPPPPPSFMQEIADWISGK